MQEAERNPIEFVSRRGTLLITWNWYWTEAANFELGPIVDGPDCVVRLEGRRRDSTSVMRHTQPLRVSTDSQGKSASRMHQIRAARQLVCAI